MDNKKTRPILRGTKRRTADKSKRFTLTALVLFGLVLLFPLSGIASGHADAQEKCVTVEDLIYAIPIRADELLIHEAFSNQYGVVMQLFANEETETYTWIAKDANGCVAIIDHGTNFNFSNIFRS